MRTWVQANRKCFISQLEIALRVQDPSAIPSFSQDGLLSTKITSWVDTPQLRKTVSQK